jgi:succinylarginine dihydrolase
MLQSALDTDPELFKAVCSSSSMWTANAATVSPSLDTQDSKLHITPANLSTKFHRSLEAHATGKVLRQILTPASHHAPLVSMLSDEGAANHIRFSAEYGKPGLELFVYGYSFDQNGIRPNIYPARQSKEACEEIISLHKLDTKNYVLAQQNPEAIDAGVFHNDVISTGNLNVFFYHEQAFLNTEETITELNTKFRALSGQDLILVKVEDNVISLKNAVETYLFNSQIVTLKDSSMLLIAPIECKEDMRAAAFIEKLIKDPKNPINQVHYFNLRESMRNGGGPACLRLRIVMSEAELKLCHQKVFLTNKLYSELYSWIEKHYRDQLSPADVVKPGFYEEVITAFKELEKILELKLV